MFLQQRLNQWLFQYKGQCMKVYNREKEIAVLVRIRELAFAQNSRMVVLTGRMRIGKTSLIERALKDALILYFFIGRKAESVLVAELVC